VGGHFNLETISFVVQKVFNFLCSNLSILSLSCWAAGFVVRNFLHTLIASRVFPALFYINCKVLGLILTSVIHFQLILVQGDR
jgi:hypothetical protein